MGAGTVLGWADELGAISEELGLLVRPYGSAAMGRATALVEGWMLAAGMEVRRDAIGNLIGRYDGAGPRTLVLGSHLDTVRDAGRYDGPLGVLVALACVARLHARSERLPYAVEVVGFADEEGLRYGTAYLGSSAFAGSFDSALLDLEDEHGVRLGEAVRAYGGNPEALARGDGAGAPEDPIGYAEVHIEQGPVLERLDLPVGVVTGIAGQSRVAIELTGEAGHAGTVPMEDRHDALCAAAELVLAAEATARATAGLLATVGRLTAQPGGGNVVPGVVRLSLDVRHEDDGVRERGCRALREQADAIAARRGIELGWEALEDAPATPTDPWLTDRLAAAVHAAGVRVRRLPSGAGHDAAELAALAPVAMLFVRCRGGVSHNPAESVRVEDVDVALDVLERFVRSLR